MIISGMYRHCNFMLRSFSAITAVYANREVNQLIFNSAIFLGKMNHSIQFHNLFLWFMWPRARHDTFVSCQSRISWNFFLSIIKLTICDYNSYICLHVADGVVAQSSKNQYQLVAEYETVYWTLFLLRVSMNRTESLVFCLTCKCLSRYVDN